METWQCSVLDPMIALDRILRHLSEYHPLPVTDSSHGDVVGSRNSEPAVLFCWLVPFLNVQARTSRLLCISAHSEPHSEMFVAKRVLSVGSNMTCIGSIQVSYYVPTYYVR